MIRIGRSELIIFSLVFFFFSFIVYHTSGNTRVLPSKTSRLHSPFGFLDSACRCRCIVVGLLTQHSLEKRQSSQEAAGSTCPVASMLGHVDERKLEDKAAPRRNNKLWNLGVLYSTKVCRMILCGVFNWRPVASCLLMNMPFSSYGTDFLDSGRSEYDQKSGKLISYKLLAGRAL